MPFLILLLDLLRRTFWAPAGLVVGAVSPIDCEELADLANDHPVAASIAASVFSLAVWFLLLWWAL